MSDYPIEPGQLMIVRANNFGPYTKWSHLVVCLHQVVSSENGTMAHCYYMNDNKENPIAIPLFLLWRIADDEDLLEMHENFIHSKNLFLTTHDKSELDKQEQQL